MIIKDENGLYFLKIVLKQFKKGNNIYIHNINRNTIKYNNSTSCSNSNQQEYEYHMDVGGEVSKYPKGHTPFWDAFD